MGLSNRLGKKKSLRDQAGDYVEAVKPRVEAVYESARGFVQDTAIPALADAKDQAVDKAGPTLADARDRAAVKAGEAKGLADAKVARLKGEPEPKKGRLKKFLLFAGIAGAVAFVAKKLQAGSSSSDNWQSSYTPSPPPRPASPFTQAAPPDTPTPAAPVAGADPLTDDPGGASPDEALADAAEAPHAVTTPDEPADVIDIEDQPRP